jgi:hypothetical protein
MPSLEIDRSMLVNRGLSVNPALAATFADNDAADIATDIVGTFKKIVTDVTVAVKDPELLQSIGAFASPLDVATYFINAKYAELGGPGGILGNTLSAVVPTSKGAGYMRSFQKGVIYWHAQVGAHEVHGPVRARWQELGAEAGFLGFPTSDVTPGNDVHSVGVFAHFQGGSIYWAPPAPHIGPVDISTLKNAPLIAATTGDAISAASAAAAAASVAAVTSTQLLAMPNIAVDVRPVVTTSGDARRVVSPKPVVNVTLGGASPSDVIAGTTAGIFTPAVTAAESSAGAFEVHGAIREKYLALGAEASILGYPRTDETGTPDGTGRFNHFQAGSIYWTPGTSAHEVHGLIRELWASSGWERNPQLGYPVSDELIPDRRVGHRRPETLKKPIVALPLDVIKLPAEAASAGFPATVVNTPPAKAVSIASTPAIVAKPALTVGRTVASSVAGSLGKLSDKPDVTSALTNASLQPGTVIGPSVRLPLDAPASTPADQRSVNRFADFENGVLFWFRGATTASVLGPLNATSDGTSLSFSGADIATAALSRIGKATFETANAQLTSMTFAGTTGYSFDGAQVHNRRHRLQFILQGVETQSGPFGVPLPSVVTATVELQVEGWFDPSRRRIVLSPTDWVLTQASSGTYASTVSAALHAKLDPLLWNNYELLVLPDTDGGAPIAILSVKTFGNGAVGVFVEPRSPNFLGDLRLISNAVTPAISVLSSTH